MRERRVASFRSGVVAAYLLLSAGSAVSSLAGPNGAVGGPEEDFPLHHAVETSSGMHPEVQLLLIRKARVDQRDERNRTPLGIAVRSGEDSLVALLLAAGAPVTEEELQVLASRPSLDEDEARILDMLLSFWRKEPSGSPAPPELGFRIQGKGEVRTSQLLAEIERLPPALPLVEVSLNLPPMRVSGPFGLGVAILSGNGMLVNAVLAARDQVDSTYARYYVHRGNINTRWRGRTPFELALEHFRARPGSLNAVLLELYKRGARCSCASPDFRRLLLTHAGEVRHRADGEPALIPMNPAAFRAAVEAGCDPREGDLIGEVTRMWPEYASRGGFPGQRKTLEVLRAGVKTGGRGVLDRLPRAWR